MTSCMWLRVVATFLAYSSASTTGSSVNKVKVNFFGESGCPTCHDFILYSVNNVLQAPGVPDIMDFTFYPFGNQYYESSDPAFPCKSASPGSYDPNYRMCFNDNCGRDAQPPLPTGCFTGTIICQHGKAECAGNLWFACAKKQSPSYTSYMQLVYCVENLYNTSTPPTTAELQVFVKQCAQNVSMDFTQLSACYGNPDVVNQLTQAQASATPSHRNGVPYIEINGKGQSVDVIDLLSLVCGATGTDPPTPAGCPASQLARTGSAKKEFSVEVSHSDSHILVHKHEQEWSMSVGH